MNLDKLLENLRSLNEELEISVNTFIKVCEKSGKFSYLADEIEALDEVRIEEEEIKIDDKTFKIYTSNIDYTRICTKATFDEMIEKAATVYYKENIPAVLWDYFEDDEFIKSCKELPAYTKMVLDIISHFEEVEYSGETYYVLFD